MRMTTPARLILTVLLALGITGLASEASAQLMFGGMQVEGEVEAGLQFFPEDPSRGRSQKFEEYRDMREGLYLGSLRLRFFRPDDSYSVEIGGTNWGQEDQNFTLRVGRIGLWAFGFEWDQTPHVLSTTARSMAEQTEPGVFTLPTPRLPLSAHNGAGELDEVSVRWDTAKLDFKLTPTPDSEISLNYSRIKKDGERPLGVAFGTPGSNFYEIAAPIDQEIHDIRLRGVVARERWQFQFGYTMSVFENGLRRILVDNPCFGNPTGCADAAAIPTGQISVAPSNMAHTVSLGGGVNLPMRTRVNGNVSYSLRLQNDSFLPHSIRFTSPDLVLPEENLDGRVHVLLGNLSVVSRPLKPLTLSAKYRIFDLNDDSNVMTFVNSVENDRVVQTDPRRNGQWSFRRQNFDLDGRTQVAKPVALTLGAGWERWDRGEHREVAESDEFFGKAALDATPADWLLARLKYVPSFRRINAYNTRAHAEHTVIEDPAAAAQGQSLLLRKFDEGERDRHKVSLDLQFTPLETLTVTPVFAWRYDDYDFNYAPVNNEQLGLLDEKSWSAGMDFSWMPVERVTFTTGYVYERMAQTMRSRSRPVTGTTTFDYTDYDWITDITDTVQTVHLTLRTGLVPKVLDLILTGNFSYAFGRYDNFNPVTPTSGTPAQDATASTKKWPAFEDTILRLSAALRYHFAKSWTATLRYAFESWEQRDWRTDGLDPFMPGTNAIWLGSDSENYTAHIVGLSFGYRFGK